MMEEKKVDVNLNMDMGMLEGKFSNMFQVATLGSESRLDCVFVDKASVNEDGAAIGKVVARILMTTDSLFELRELLDRHIDGLGASKDIDNAE